MKVAFIHSKYSSAQPSGENFAVLSQLEALTAEGIEARLIFKDTDEESRHNLYSIKKAASVATGMGPSPLEELKEFSPDVVHVHNLFPNWGRSWIKAWDGPIVSSLYNFRNFCSNGMLLREDKLCTLCPQKGQIHGIKHKCYKNSVAATIPIAISNLGGYDSNLLLSKSKKIIALSECSKQMFHQFGIPEEKLAYIPNSLNGDLFSAGVKEMRHWVFIGRLSSEKGILPLMDSWPANQTLNIYGDGPLREEVIRRSGSNLRYMGSINREDVVQVFRTARGLLFPSTCLEGGTPIVYLEALASGTPVIAYKENSVATEVSANEIGFVYQSHEELSSALNQPTTLLGTYGKNAHKYFVDNYDSKVNVQRLISLYKQVIDD